MASDDVFVDKENSDATVSNFTKRLMATIPVENYGMPQVIQKDGKCVSRTVIMTNIPQIITLRTLLNNIRGGTIFKANIVRVQGRQVQAIVSFVNPIHALHFVEFHQKYPLMIHHDDGMNNLLDFEVKVALVSTKSYEFCDTVKTALANQASRCLIVNNFPEHKVREFVNTTLLSYCLTGQCGAIANITYDTSKNILTIELGDLMMAVRIATFIQRHHGLLTQHFKDPCANPLKFPVSRRKDKATKNNCLIELDMYEYAFDVMPRNFRDTRTEPSVECLHHPDRRLKLSLPKYRGDSTTNAPVYVLRIGNPQNPYLRLNRYARPGANITSRGGMRAMDWVRRERLDYLAYNRWSVDYMYVGEEPRWEWYDEAKKVTKLIGPTGTGMILSDFWKEFEYDYEDTDNPIFQKLLDLRYDSTGQFNVSRVRRIVGRRYPPSPANLWGLLNGNAR
jgi:hypothetical protein